MERIREGEEEESEWQNMHRPLLDLIMQKLSFADRIRATGVCRWWRQERGAGRPKLPWLVYRNASTHEATHTIFSHDGRHRDVDLPCTRSKDFMGSGHGWLLYSCKQTRECFLLNPVTASRVDLPPHPGRSDFSTPAFISADPATADLDSVVVLFTVNNLLLFCRPTDERWFSFKWYPYHDDHAIADIVACKGKMYLLTELGRFGRINIGPLGDVDIAWLINKEPVQPSMLGRLSTPPTRFLVESSGDVLLVSDHNRLYDGRLVFDVYKADLDGMAWAPAPDLRGRRLFLGRCCSISAASLDSDTPGGRRIHVGYPGDDLKWHEEARRSPPWERHSTKWALRLASMVSNWFWLLPSFSHNSEHR